MIKTFFGLNVKTSVQVVFWLNLIEYVVLYIMNLVLMMSVRQSISNVSAIKLQSTAAYQDEIEGHVKLLVSKGEWANLGAVFSMFGATIAMFCLLIENSKVWKYLWLIFQGLSIEILTLIVLRLVMTEKPVVRFVVSVFPALTFLLLKVYSWLLVVSALKSLRSQERREKFGTQWINNTLLVTPNVGLSFPDPDLFESQHE